MTTQQWIAEMAKMQHTYGATLTESDIGLLGEYLGVGPAYKEVGARYRNDPHALTKVEASIHDGGHGKWGEVPMPPFDHLSAVDLKTLAECVLRQ